MQLLLAALLGAFLIVSSAWADSTPGNLGVATTTLVSGLLPFDQGPGTDTALGFNTTTFDVSAGLLILKTGGVADAKLASTFLKINAALGTPVSGDATNLTNIPVANAKSGSILPIGNLTALPASNFFAGDAGGRPIAASATGDFGCGTAAAGFITCTVTGLRGRSLDTAAPNDGDVYAWSAGGSKWAPVAQTGGGGGGSGTVNSGTTPQAAYYASSTTAVSGASGVTFPGAVAVAVGSPTGSSPGTGIVDVATGFQVNGVNVGQVVAGTNQTVSAAQWAVGTTFVVLTSGQTLILPATTTLSTSGGIVIQTIGQAVSLAPNGSDTINGSNTTATIASGLTAVVSTNGAGAVYASPTTAGSGSGTVTSVTFTGDGVVDSSTPSSAVTASGTVTATIKTQTANTVLAGPVSGGAVASAFRALVPLDLGGSAASHGTLIDVAGTPTWKVVPDCTDTGGNHLNYTQSSDAFSCGTSGGSGSLTVTDGTNSVASTTTLTTGPGFVVGGSAGSATLNHTATLNTQSGAGAYTILSTDAGKTVNRTNSSTVSDLIPQATGSFASGFGFGFKTTTGINTLTATTSTINGIAGATGIKMGPQQTAYVFSNGTNWLAEFGLPTPPTQTSTLYLDDDFSWKASQGTGAQVRATTPTLTTPVLGVATATSINKVALTQPSSAATLTIADGKTLTDTSGVGAVLLKGATGGGFAAAVAADIPATTFGTGTTHNLAAPREYWECTGTCTVTPPTPAAGYEFCVRNVTGVSTVITLAAVSSVLYEKTDNTAYGTANTAATSGGAVGDKVCLVGKDSTHYDVFSFTGTWSMP